MKKQILSLFGLMAIVLLVGAGCAQTQDSSIKNDGESAKNAENQNIVEKTNIEEKNEGSITLSAEKTNIAGEVLLSWIVPKSLKSDDGYRIIRSLEKNPVWPGSYWFHQDASRDHITWINIPTGIHNFRICRFISGECAEYSNEVSVQIIGKAKTTSETFTTARTEVETVRGFYNALMSDNKDNALAFVPESVQATEYFKTKWLKIANWQFQNLEIRIDTITGDIFSEKKVDVGIGVKIDDVFQVGSDQVTIDYRNGKWWIVDFPT